MPEEGIKYLPKKEIVTFEEIERLISLLAQMGITKIRFTGGEPFVRADLMNLISRVVEIPGISEFHITTNGVLTAPYIPALKKLGIGSVNLSLDTIDRERFKAITRRDELPAVLHTLDELLKHKIPVKINAVVMDGKNIDDIIPLIKLAKHDNIAIRFIEEMPFNGVGNHYPTLYWNHKHILAYIKNNFPDLHKLNDPSHSTASLYNIPGYKGTIGVIAAYSRTFCGTCNRLRVTAQGTLKTCLYDNGVLDLKALLRSQKSDQEIKLKLLAAFSTRAQDGFEAERQRDSFTPATESMSTIGG